MSKTQHTPTPWSVLEITGDIWHDEREILSRGVAGPDGRSLNKGEDSELFSREDVEHIVHCVNSYSALQSQNEKMRSALIAIEDHMLRSDGSALVARIARGALEVPSE